MKNMNKIVLLSSFIFNLPLVGMHKNKSLENEITRLNNNLESQIGRVGETLGRHLWYSAPLSDNRLIIVAKRVTKDGYPSYFGHLEINRSTETRELIVLPQERVPEYFNILEAKYKKQNIYRTRMPQV